MEQALNILTTVFYFVVTIGILVFVHEFGHFAAAKLTGMRVDRFSIGFPPRAFGKKVGDTDYCVSWIPIGGYVKIAGMIDESFDTHFLASEP
ncbi:MAG TPA: site-2 protease family protein, partial [Bacteroidota bacterium]